MFLYECMCCTYVCVTSDLFTSVNRRRKTIHHPPHLSCYLQFLFHSAFPPPSLLLLLLLLPLPHPLPLLLLIVPFSNSLHLSTSHSLSLLYPNSGVFLPQVSHRKPSVYPPAFPSASLPPD
uniref:Uncharacterized protein n=1 Tax=Cacopsylla melanoneura TaxID=428564 RepID=A0A8D9BJU2_9HEMI